MRIQKRQSEELKEQYRKFIHSLQLKDIFIEEASFKRFLKDEEIPEKAHIEVVIKPTKTEFNTLEDNYFEVKQNLLCSFQFSDKEQKCLAQIKARYYLLYQSETPITDGLKEIFKKRNIPVQIWPYLREFVSNCMLRMGLPPFILPVMKVG